MQIISETEQLHAAMRRCIISFTKYSFATAWASAGTDVFDLLYSYKDRIECAVIGTHFYQTDPKVLEAFANFSTVRFRLQTSGVFHPKVYAFWDEKQNWEVLIGSANLTGAALKANQELMISISSVEEPGSAVTFNDIRVLVKQWWKTSQVVTLEDAKAYREFWQQHKYTRNILSGEYGASQPKIPMESPLMRTTWSDFYTKIIGKDPHDPEGRCSILRDAKNEFLSKKFKDMDEKLRLSIAGCNRSLFREQDWRWFGSIPQGKFPAIVKSNNIHLSEALDKIPLVGPIKKAHYMEYIEEFLKAFPDGGDGLAVVTRLITIKRPDYFVCLNDKNRTALCGAFDINDLNSTEKNYERYWDDIVARIMTSIWWFSPEPIEDGLEKSVWLGRAAMLDAIYYDSSASA